MLPVGIRFFIQPILAGHIRPTAVPATPAAEPDAEPDTKPPHSAHAAITRGTPESTYNRHTTQHYTETPPTGNQSIAERSGAVIAYSPRQ